MKNTKTDRAGKTRRRDFVRASLAATAVAMIPGGRVWGESGGSGGKLAVVSRTGKQIELARSDVDVFAASLRGTLIQPSDRLYDTARMVWNGSFDKHPALIARCASAADVIEAVNFTRSHDLLTAVRGGGHSISGQSVCDGGLVIDLSPLKAIRVDPAARTARAQPGVLLGEIDRETQAFGLATTFGTVPETGLAGLTLGGGLGRLARKYGLTCDNLRAVDIVTADGKLLRANDRENTDLFWAVRGGGGNFGIVTEFEYQLHPLGTSVLAGVVLYPFTNARDVLRTLADFSESAPDELYLNPIIVSLPDGRGVGFEVCYCGPLAEGERLLAPLRKLGKPLSDQITRKSYVEAQGGFGTGLPAGRSYYFKSGFLPRVTPKMIDELVENFATAPPSLLSVPLIHLGGAAGRVKPDATAFWNRDARHDLAVWASWGNRADSERIIADVRGFWRRLEHLTKGYYINTDTPDDERRLRETYGGNYERLVQLKNRYDPTNLFHLNANIRPTRLSP
jgi:FAD/FMN-containing dehydrogenase